MTSFCNWDFSRELPDKSDSGFAPGKELFEEPQIWSAPTCGYKAAYFLSYYGYAPWKFSRLLQSWRNGNGIRPSYIATNPIVLNKVQQMFSKKHACLFQYFC